MHQNQKNITIKYKHKQKRWTKAVLKKQTPNVKCEKQLEIGGKTVVFN